MATKKLNLRLLHAFQHRGKVAFWLSGSNQEVFWPVERAIPKTLFSFQALKKGFADLRKRGRIGFKRLGKC